MSKKTEYLVNWVTYLFIAVSLVLDYYHNDTLVEVLHIIMWTLSVFSLALFSVISLLIVYTDSKEKYDNVDYPSLYKSFKSGKGKYFGVLTYLSVMVLYKWTYLIIIYILALLVMKTCGKQLKTLINKYSIKE